MNWKEFQDHSDIAPIKEADFLIINKVNNELNNWVETTINNLKDSKDAESEFANLFFDVRKKYVEQLIKPIASYEILIKGNDNNFPLIFNQTNLNKILTIFDSIFKHSKKEDRINLFKKSFFEFKLAKSKYHLLKQLLLTVNENVINPKDRLPNFDTFEVSTLHHYKEQTKIASKLNDNYEDQISNLLSRNKESIQELRELNQEILKLEKKYYKADTELSEVKSELKTTKNQYQIIKNYIPVLESSNVIQFDITYWGDNYPALKVFFNFLIERKISYLNWSLFASLMCKGNEDPIDFTFNDFSKKDYGYMFYLLKEFFVFEIRKDRSSFNDFLNFKFRINGSKFKKNDISKFVRNYGVDVTKIGTDEIESSELKN